ncbi:MAG: aminotransferase class I/II-fold pyridoxal phosphate-dependent enzyme [Limisphaerales bacterium]
MFEPPVFRLIDETHVLHAGRAYTHFSGSDYFRLSWHPEVRRAAERGIREYGTGICASRMTTGNARIYGELERALARFFGVESATLTSAGYTAPIVVAQALADDHGRVLLDSKAHGCLRDAAVLTGLPVVDFRHGDAKDLERRVRARRGNSRDPDLVLCNGLDAVDGRVGPIAEYAAVLGGERGTLVVDDAHGAGVLGRRGRGAVEWSGLAFDRVVVTLTLSKAFGSYGGVVLGDRGLRRRILERSRLFTGNTPPAPSSVAASLGALGVIAREGAALREKLRNNLDAIPDWIRGGGSGVGPGPGPGPMFSVAGTDAEAERLRRLLLKKGIHPPLIRYPNGPASRYFRFALSTAHSATQIGELVEVLQRHFRREGRELR